MLLKCLYFLLLGTYFVSMYTTTLKTHRSKGFLYFDRPIRLSHLVVISSLMLVAYDSIRLEYDAGHRRCEGRYNLHI
jgi:hypothetical protein